MDTRVHGKGLQNIMGNALSDEHYFGRKKVVIFLSNKFSILNTITQINTI